MVKRTRQEVYVHFFMHTIETCAVPFRSLHKQLVKDVNFDVLRYVDVILQLIDKAGDFVSDDIWFRVVQFVTNNEDLQVLKIVRINILFILFMTFKSCLQISLIRQPYAASKAREYMDKIAIHETMVKVVQSRFP